MFRDNGYISRYITAIAFFIITIPRQVSFSQERILDSTFTIRAGSMRTGNALNLITRETGFFFTYDSRLIDPDKKTEMNFTGTSLKDILNSILQNDSLTYSVIDEFIVISRAMPPPDLPADSAAVKTFNTITGVIVDGESAEPLPYATIGLKNAGKGTVSNSAGEFSLRMTAEYYYDTLTVSYLGYYRREIPVRQSFGSNFRISMRREFFSIPEIIIRNQIPREIINKCLVSIGRNYGNAPANLTAFYREGVIKRNRLQSYSEAVLEIYKSPYTGSLLSDQIKVYKSRKIENISVNDSLLIRLKAGLSTCLELDGVKNIFDFIDRQRVEEYSYRLTDIVSFNEESAFEIEFARKEESDIAIFRGSLFINTSDYAILRAEFEIIPAYLQKMKGSFISSPSKDFKTWPVSVKYYVSYRKVGERYFLSHVRGDLGFISRQKKRLFNTQSDVFFEMAITDIRQENVERFEREELAPIHSVFSKTITEYDPVFWGNQDFLKPEDNLLQSLRNMKVRLQEFTE